MKKITLAICTNRGIRPKTAQCLLDLVARGGYEFHVLVAERGYTIAENRNYCAVQALKNSSDFLLFIDDDMVFPADTLDRLLYHGKEIVGVNSYSRCLPLAPTTGLMDDKGNYKHPNKYPAFEMKIPDELFKAYFVGCGVCLIDMRVFGIIKKPWFAFIGGNDGQVIHGEDGSFCDKARKAGVDIWCDPTIPIGHLGEYEFKQEQL